MKAKKIVAANPPERGILKMESAAIQAARLERNWVRFNRLTVADILGQLHQLTPTSESKTHVREFTRGLFTVIETARRALLDATGAPGIISQEELGLFERYARWGTELRDAWWKDLVSRVQVGWRVEPGMFFMCAERIGLNVGRANATQRASYAPTLPRPEPTARQTDPQTPSPETLQAWFDLPSEPPRAEGSPAGS